MAGTIFGLPLSQRVDLNGNPSVGWLLYIYQANTSTPVNSYQDQALTVLNTWPIIADSFGMMGQFWLADGSYRVRGTNANGSVIYFDQPSVLALGASSGQAPSGGVDPNAIYQTGDIKLLETSSTPAGWVRNNGRTIGSASSGASERANSDCQNLFTWLWNFLSNTACPVSGGRGASANADWLANKTIGVPDHRGLALVGADSMGNSAANRFTGVPFTSGDKDTPGSVCGEPIHVTIAAEMPSHSHTGSGNTGGTSNDHTHSQIASTSTGSYSAGGSSGPLGAGSQTGGQSADHTHAFSFTTNAAGSGQGHNNVQLCGIVYSFRKL